MRISAIRLLEQGQDRLETDLNVATCKSKAKEDEGYRTRFASLLSQTRQTEMELNEQRQIELDVDKQIAMMEVKLRGLVAKSKKKSDDERPLPYSVNNTIITTNGGNTLR